ncbi:tetratricopeptide repeat protein [Raoultella ornithinolytica]|uniref:tetratricopeptide repeat protein n=1 Tax=Raoultella ornithinolytica TaxID=54291 RepID=UPI00195022DF|nr:tetratricopeptide repeat protein [Raoultella ornithinolytica]MBM6479578.1 tetratricopeptide repeat protein [Raoultella ornithinolytica]HAT1601688.1 tetratricopeptide repeat protein [Raoultella ornithinolytica]HDS8974318.1 tetratricopeptide repeat protein [Raoultella ornithinolytica]HDT1246978.1 tetratricopeptide repeat protein [Raoultella ornithinolytica]HDV8761896.1 tetratricopeptide repeat protein [Raoultella ornithinolytica]
MGKIISLTSLLALFVLCGCQSQTGSGSELDDSQREYILSKVNNYNGLIKLYREKLSRKEDKDTRYQLAEYYYLAEDFDSSRQYLQPLIANNPDERALLLASKNLMEFGDYREAQAAISGVLRQNPKSGEAWNIQGILLAQDGDFPGATRAFNSARQRFVDDDIVINNLAMLAIMQNDYATARDYLFSLYGRGHASQKVLHNLVYVLVKLQDFNAAESILQQEKMADRSDGLMEALAKVNPRPRAPSATLSAAAPVSIAESAAPAVKSGEQAGGGPLLVRTAAAGRTPVATQDELARFLDNQQTAKPAGLPEKASLSLTSSLKDISAVRSGRHPGYFRMILESRHAINFRELPGTDKNKRIFELQNVRLGNALLRAAEDITREHPDINKLTFYQHQADAVLIEFEFTRSLAKAKVFRLASDKAPGERLVFDIYYG